MSVKLKRQNASIVKNMWRKANETDILVLASKDTGPQLRK